MTAARTWARGRGTLVSIDIDEARLVSLDLQRFGFGGGGVVVVVPCLGFFLLSLSGFFCVVVGYSSCLTAFQHSTSTLIKWRPKIYSTRLRLRHGRDSACQPGEANFAFLG